MKMAWELLKTGIYPISRYSKERSKPPCLRFYDNKNDDSKCRGQITGNIAWFDSIQEARYVKIYLDKKTYSIKLEPKRRPVIDSRKVRYKNGEVFIGGGKLLREQGFPYGRYEMTGKNIFRYKGQGK